MLIPIPTLEGNLLSFDVLADGVSVASNSSSVYECQPTFAKHLICFVYLSSSFRNRPPRSTPINDSFVGKIVGDCGANLR